MSFEIYSPAMFSHMYDQSIDSTSSGNVDWSTEINKPINIDLDSLNYNVTILGETLTSEQLRDIVTSYYKQNYPEKLV